MFTLIINLLNSTYVKKYILVKYKITGRRLDRLKPQNDAIVFNRHIMYYTLYTF